MQSSGPDHYATLGLHRRCTDAEIRNAYRLLAKQFHPDVNGSADSHTRIQSINAAYETLGDSVRREAYDRARDATSKRGSPNSTQTSKSNGKISQDMHLRPEEFLRGTTLEVRVNDPSNVAGPEIYSLPVPPGTAPGKSFRVPRTANDYNGVVLVRLRVRPDFRFKARGSDLRCDLRINAQRAAQGGVESVSGLNGTRLRVDIPKDVRCNEVVRLPGEGLPKLRGGRGDLLVRIVYRPEVRIVRQRVR